MEKEDDTFHTDDLAISGYLMMKDVKMIRHEQKNNHICFVFAGQEECKKLHIEFLNSGYRKYDAAIRDLKKLVKRR